MISDYNPADAATVPRHSTNCELIHVDKPSAVGQVLQIIILPFSYHVFIALCVVTLVFNCSFTINMLRWVFP